MTVKLMGKTEMKISQILRCTDYRYPIMQIEFISGAIYGQENDDPFIGGKNRV
jgi:hypothetical protein